MCAQRPTTEFEGVIDSRCIAAGAAEGSIARVVQEERCADDGKGLSQCLTLTANFGAGHILTWVVGCVVGFGRKIPGEVPRGGRCPERV